MSDTELNRYYTNRLTTTILPQSELVCELSEADMRSVQAVVEGIEGQKWKSM
jgi:hypothetical protein